ICVYVYAQGYTKLYGRHPDCHYQNLYLRKTTMHKTDLVIRVAEQTDLSREKADTAVSAIIEHITNALSRNEAVSLIGFGSFTRTQRRARTGRNPQTGEAIDIAASNGVLFKPGKALKDAVNHRD